MNNLEHLATEQSGQTMAEYAVVLTIITVAVVATLTLLSSGVINVINQVITLM
jgi:Flp pilus assembly pilin Flp